MVVLEEPDTVVLYVRICGGTDGVIRPPTRLRTSGTRGNFGIIARVRHITAYENCVLNTPGEVTRLSP